MKSNFRFAQLQVSDCLEADLTRANLLRANFWKACMQNAEFHQAELQGSFFDEADMRGAHFARQIRRSDDAGSGPEVRKKPARCFAAKRMV